MADIQEDALEDAVKSLGNMGHEVMGVPTDVSKWDAIQALAEKTMAEFGAVNVLHNNAGVLVSGPIAELTLADWEWVLGVDLWSVIYGVKAFLPLIRQSGQGHIINTASVNGLQASGAIFLHRYFVLVRLTVRLSSVSVIVMLSRRKIIVRPQKRKRLKSMRAQCLLNEAKTHQRWPIW